MLTQELSASMERLVLSVVILIGSFLMIGIALAIKSEFTATILVMASGLMGGVAAAWQLGNQAKQVGDQLSSSQHQAVEQVSMPPPTIPPEVVKAALTELLKEQVTNK